MTAKEHKGNLQNMKQLNQMGETLVPGQGTKEPTSMLQVMKRHPIVDIEEP